MKLEIIEKKINEFGAKGIPFLFAINFEMTEGFFMENPMDQNEILFKTPLGTNFREDTNLSSQKANKPIRSIPEPFERYNSRFEKVKSALKRGDSFLVNLTIKTPIETNLSLKEIFELSNAPYTLYVPNKFVCFSPERFIHISDQKISTNPMKGTINANIPDAENIILNDKKETAEHNTIVDLLRNDLSIVANNVAVDKFRYIDRIKTKESDILQVSSEISGKINEKYKSKLGSLIFQMLPAGSISGAPKDSTIKIIEDAEGELRGFYTGIFGYFDGKELDSAVLIRFIEEENGLKYFRSGGGVTASSNAMDEYQEVINKIYLPFL